MNRYESTVFKTGNSYALRVPKRYIEDAHLKVGDKAAIALPTSTAKQNHERIQQILKEAQSIRPRLFASIPDPVQWQRETRKDRSLPGRS